MKGWGRKCKWELLLPRFYSEELLDPFEKELARACTRLTDLKSASFAAAARSSSADQFIVSAPCTSLAKDRERCTHAELIISSNADKRKEKVVSTPTSGDSPIHHRTARRTKNVVILGSSKAKKPQNKQSKGWKTNLFLLLLLPPLFGGKDVKPCWLIYHGQTIAVVVVDGVMCNSPVISCLKAADIVLPLKPYLLTLLYTCWWIFLATGSAPRQKAPSVIKRRLSPAIDIWKSVTRNAFLFPQLY